MRCRERVEEYLSTSGVSFEIEQHRLAYTAQQLAAAQHVTGKHVAKVVVVVANGAMLLLVLPASSSVNLEKLKMGLRATELRLAREEEFATTFHDCEVGAMPPFGNLYGVPVYVDRSLAKVMDITFPVGSHTESLKIRYFDFERLVHPKVLEFAAVPTAQLSGI